MRQFCAALAAAAVLAAPAFADPGRVFTVVPSSPPDLPSYVEPNAPGTIVVPLALSTPPGQPASLSYGDLSALWHRAGDAYGVPWQVLAAINKVESNFGANMGPSSAGAIGWMQFMPSTWMRWGLDADGDGLANPWDPEDAVFAAARYLAAAGAHDDLARAVFAYNHADWYVDEVLELAATFDEGDAVSTLHPSPSAAAFRLEALEAELGQARRAAARARLAVPSAEAAISRLDHEKLVLTRRAGDPTIPVRVFENLEARIARIERAQDREAGRLARAQASLQAAAARVESLRSEVVSAAVASPPVAALDAGDSIDGYVFPVGGGPESVSVGHYHHDYPAADIAAPEGAPLYALADSVVVDAYPEGSGNCGIGLKLRLANGVVYVYCHLSYLEPGVVPGAALAAGAPVGRVGETGHATGPHLHLQLDPAVAYPQEEPWFESFAGGAFTWQDAPTPKVERGLASAAPKRPARAGRVFRVVSRTSASTGTNVVTFTR